MQDTSNILLYTAPAHNIGSRLKKSIQSISKDSNIIVAKSLASQGTEKFQNSVCYDRKDPAIFCFLRV